MVTGTTWPPNSIIKIGQSTDDGQTRQEKTIDFGHMSKDGAQDPYTIVTPDGAYTNFLERPDGTWMFACSMHYPDWDDWLNEDQTRPGLGAMMVRTSDGGKTWCDPTIVHQHCTETEFAVDPHNPDHILASGRIQRGLLPGEDQASTGCNFGWDYKNALLLDSTDGAAHFASCPTA